jgi:hypothetical protein
MSGHPPSAVGSREARRRVRSSSCLSLQLRRNQEFLQRDVIFHPQYIRLAADLAVLDIALPPPGRLVYRSHIPLPATRALKPKFQSGIIEQGCCSERTASSLNFSALNFWFANWTALKTMDEAFPSGPALLLKFVLPPRPKDLLLHLRIADTHTTTPSCRRNIRIAFSTKWLR